MCVDRQLPTNSYSMLISFTGLPPNLFLCHLEEVTSCFKTLSKYPMDHHAIFTLSHRKSLNFVDFVMADLKVHDLRKE